MNKKVQEIHRRLIINDNFTPLLKKYRKKIGLPPSGLSNWKEYESRWKKEKNLIGLSGGEENYYVHEFYKEAGVMLQKICETNNEWEDVLFDYLFFNKTNRLNSVNVTGCSVIMESDNQPPDSGIPDKFSGNVYIKIGLNTSSLDILKFVKAKGDLIKAAQEFLLYEFNLKNKQRIRTSPMADRDAMINELNKLNRETLSELSGLTQKAREGKYLPPTYKTSCIQELLLQRGYGEINDGTIRKVISRQKKLREK